MTTKLIRHAQNLSRFYERAKQTRAITHLDRATYLQGCKPPGTSDRAWNRAVVATVEPSEAIVNARTHAVNVWDEIAGRWQKSKQRSGKLLAFNLWEKLRIVASQSDPQTLSLLVRALGWQWESAGKLHWSGGGWQYFPGKSTSLARETLKAIVLKFLGIAIDVGKDT